MKKFKRFLLRPVYYLYRVCFKIKYPRIIADGKYRPIAPFTFNEWVYSKGFFPKHSYLLRNTLLSDLNIVVPKGYAEFVKKYPNLSPLNMMKHLQPVETVKSLNKIFYHYETDGSVTQSDKPGERVTVTINKK